MNVINQLEMNFGDTRTILAIAPEVLHHEIIQNLRRAKEKYLT